MYKVYPYLYAPPGHIAKILHIMRLIIIFVLIGFLQVNAKSGYAQKITLSLHDAPLLTAFDQISLQSGYDFIVTDKLMKEARAVSIDVKDANLERVLKNIFQHQSLTYVIGDHRVIIRKKEKDLIDEVKDYFMGEDTDAPQQRIVQGTIVDSLGKPLKGVSIQIKKTNMKIFSDSEGKFSMIVPSDHETLIFSYIGMQKQEISVNGTEKNLYVVLKISEEVLEDVVVTGYTTVRKSSFTGTSTHVTKNEILKVNPQNLISALQVFDPSFRISPNNQMGSDPNTLPEFYIRGRSGLSSVTELDKLQSSDVSQYSLSNNPNLPIFIMDGYEVPMQTVYDYDINRIESVTILKDAAATAIYGSRASNGVIVIETVAPKPGKLRISYNLNTVITAPDLSAYNLMNAPEKLNAEVAAGLIDPVNPKTGLTSDYFSRLNYYRGLVANLAEGINTDWLSQPLQTDVSLRHSLYLEGGVESLRFGVGLNYDGQDGVMKESSRNRIGADFKIDYRMKGIQISNQVSFNQTRSQNSPYGNFGDYTKQQPYYTPYDLETGEYVKTLPSSYGAGLTSANPLYEATLGNFEKSGYKSFTDNLSLNALFFKKLQLRAQFSIKNQIDNGKTFVDPNSSRYLYTTTDYFMRGELTTNTAESFSWNTNVVLNYANTINGHNVNFSLGYNATEDKANNTNSFFRGFPSAELHDQKYAHEIVNTPAVQDKISRLMGTFMFANYTYKDIYLADVSARLDGSSEFGSDNRFATFWSLGTGINFHKYDFMKSVTWLPMARIRANYGQTGKNNFPPYAARTTYQVMLDYWYPTGIGGKLYSMGNNQLMWEKANTLNIGMDLNVLNRVIIGLNWYDKRTKNLITDMTIPSSTGFTSYKENVGEVMNRGYEIDLNVSAIKEHDFNLDLIFRGAHNNNQIVKISDAMKEYNDRVDAYYADYYANATNQTNPKFATPLTKYVEGGSETSIFGMRSLGISPATGQEMFMNRDGQVTYTWNSAEQVIIGNREPTLNGSFGINLRYKAWTLYSTFLYEWGGDEYNSTLVGQVENVDVWEVNADRRVMDLRWQKPGDITMFKSIKDRYNVTLPTSRFVQKNDNLTFNSISLGYTFGHDLVKRWGLSMLRMQAGTNDLAYFATIKRERGLSYPYARTFNFTLNASF
ncbi:TonB-linked outer membrane protein, SusC/RagA family [bacterium A37T11]|nr:TonB-linked outer membrane protein, SusC/RagA family [bacterium A37T11]